MLVMFAAIKYSFLLILYCKLKIYVEFPPKRKVIAQCNGYRIMTPSAFRLVPYKLRFHYAILSATGYDLPGKVKAPFTARRKRRVQPNQEEYQ